MAAVTLYSLVLKDWNYQGETMKGFEMVLSSQQNTLIFLLGNVASFGVAFLAVKMFIRFLQKYGFKVWGIYRILVGVVLLLVFLNQPKNQDPPSSNPTVSTSFRP
ncbi:MAG: undecaprenyl-diphosphate phosphatase [Flavobacteriia bacterium]|jgi:undecaprenyl-diphosphatase|nr:undecaprenyl-diphosphate phosphatase [Flavobacteriia bacterium]